MELNFRIEHSVLACFFKITIFPISLSNVKWISLMLEFYVHTKIYLDYFPRRLKYAELGKSVCLKFSVPVPKVVELTP